MASFQAEVVDHLLAVSPLNDNDQATLRDTLLDAPGQVPQDDLLAQRILNSVCISTWHGMQTRPITNLER